MHKRAEAGVNATDGIRPRWADVQAFESGWTMHSLIATAHADAYS